MSAVYFIVICWAYALFCKIVRVEPSDTATIVIAILAAAEAIRTEVKGKGWK